MSENTSILEEQIIKLISDTPNRTAITRLHSQNQSKFGGRDALMVRLMNRLWQEKKWGKLIIYFNLLTSGDEKNPKILGIAGKAYRKIGDPLTGTKLLEASIALADSVPFSHELALSYTDIGKFGHAAEKWIVLLNSEPDSLRWLTYASNALADDGRVEEADRLIKSAIDQFPDRPEIQHRRAKFFVNQKKFHMASEIYLLLVSNDPENKVLLKEFTSCTKYLWDEHLAERAYYFASNYLKKNFDMDLATDVVLLLPRLPPGMQSVTYLEDIEGQCQNDPMLLNALAKSYFVIGRLEAAQNCLEKLVSISPQNISYIHVLAGILAQRSDINRAVELLTDYTPSDQDKSVHLAKIGHIQAQAGNVGEAISILKQAIESDPENPLPVADIGYCYERTGDFELAIHFAKMAYQMSQNTKLNRTWSFNEMTQASQMRLCIFAMQLEGNNSDSLELLKEYFHRESFELDYEFEQWRGEDLSGKSIMAVSEHGLGDQIRLLTVLDHILTPTTQCMMTCDPRMKGLIGRSFPMAKLFPVAPMYPRLREARTEKRRSTLSARMRSLTNDAVISAGEEADYWVNMPYAMNIRVAEKPFEHNSVRSAILEPDSVQKELFSNRIRTQAGSSKVIGLSWRGAVGGYKRDRHYFDIKQLSPLLELSDFYFVVINYVLSDKERKFLQKKLGHRFIDFPDLDLKDDLDGVAALCSVLDLAICVSTSVLELAASVGTKTLYLLSAPYLAHRHRLMGPKMSDGSYSDKMWQSVRILPLQNQLKTSLIDDAVFWVRRWSNAENAMQNKDMTRLKYGVLTFGYQNFSSLQKKLKQQGYYSTNIGDNMQSLAVRQLYERLGIGEEEIVSINRDEMTSYSGGHAVLIMNGCFYERSFPLPDNITPVFVGFQTHKEAVEKHASYFKCFEPIGCRDKATECLFREQGIQAYTTGCLTMTFRKEAEPSTKRKVVFVYGSGSGGLPTEIFKYIPDDLQNRVEFVFQRLIQQKFPLSEEGMLFAEAYSNSLLQKYTQEAALVVTPLHHAAAPCMALGIPVIICRKAFNSRFTFLEEFTPIYTPEKFDQISWTPDTVDLTEFKRDLDQSVQRILQSKLKEISLR